MKFLVEITELASELVIKWKLKTANYVAFYGLLGTPQIAFYAKGYI